MNLKKLLLLVMAFSICGRAFSQITLPQLTPQSPTAAALHKFTDYPVSLNTGLVDIGVPIYTVEADGIKVPISLKYHASGIKYDDVSREVGIGWSLMAGGMITAQQMGTPDGAHPTFFKLAANIVPEQTETENGNPLPTDGEDNDNHKLIDVAKGIRDSEYDMYSYSFLNYSGKFFYPGTTNPVFSPRRNFKVTYGTTSGSGMFNKNPFTILDEDGVSYKFGKDRDNNTIAETPSGISTTNVNLMLTEIVSADKSDTIRFKYTGVSTFVQDQLFKRMVIDNQKIVYDNLGYRGSYTGALPTDAGGGTGVNFQGFTYCRLDEISFKGGKVVFTYNSNQQLTDIKVYNNITSVPVKTVTLTQSAFTGNTDYYKLDEVKFKDAGATKSYSYTFDYNGVPNAKRSGVDFWGYYNDTADPTTTTGWGYVPDFSLFNSAWPAIGTADRRPDETGMKKGILNKVTYPTGGHSIFTYEAHRYGTGQIAGGLRIKSIENFSETGVSTGQKWYKYGVSESGNGTLFRNIDPADYCTTMQNVGNDYATNAGYILRERRFESFPLYSYSSLGSTVTYDQVTEYTGDGTTSNGKTVYTYENFTDNTYGSPSPMNGPIPMIYRSNAWKTGNLLSKYVYKQGGTLISQVTNVYKDVNYNEYACLKVVPYLNWIDGGGHAMTYDQVMEYWLTRAPLYGITWGGGYLRSPYSYADYLLSSGARVLDYTTEVNDGVTRTTTYTYEGTYDKPRTVTTTESNGVNKVQQFTYSFDKGSGSPYPAMVTRNIINPVVQQDDYKSSVGSGNLLQSTITDWYDYGSNIIKPQLVSTSKAGGTAEPRMRYNSYDALGNIQTVSKENGPKTTYLWSYNGAYPIAKIENADYSTIETVLGGSSVVNNIRDNNLTSNVLSSYIYSLRSATSLKNALITSYTYDPLVGETSMTDPKGNTTYYEYDEFNRLSVVRDKDKNIVKAICYNYKGQATNCFVPQVRVYARVEYTNYEFHFTNDGEDAATYWITYDAAIHLYSDEECTQAYTPPSAASVIVKKLDDYTHTEWSTTYYEHPYHAPITYSVTGSTYSLGNVTLSHTQYAYDMYNSYYRTHNYDYQVIINPGSIYRPLPSL